MIDFMRYALLGIIVVLVLNFLGKLGKQKVSARIEGMYCLKVHVLYGVVGYASFVFGIIFLAWAFLERAKDSETHMLVLLGIVVSFLWICGVVLVLLYRNHRLEFDDNTIIVTSSMGKQKRVSWSEVQAGKFNPYSGYLRLETNSTSIKVHQHLVGISSFLRKVDAETGMKFPRLG